MADVFRFDAGWRWDDPRVFFDTEVPPGLTPDTPLTPMSADNQISATMTPAQVAAFLAKLAEAAALLPAVPEKTDAELKRLLGVDGSTELDEIGAEVMAAHPEWKPVRTVLADYAQDSALFHVTAPMVVPTEALARTITVLRRLAAHDTRRNTLDVYAVVKDLAESGNIEAQAYYARMSVFFQGGPGGGTPPPPTP